MRNKIKTFLYGQNVFSKAKQIGKGLYVGGCSKVNENTILGDFVHFNGMEIQGRGTVKIGSYLHSGTDCLIVA